MKSNVWLRLVSKFFIYFVSTVLVRLPAISNTGIITHGASNRSTEIIVIMTFLNF